MDFGCYMGAHLMALFQDIEGQYYGCERCGFMSAYINEHTAPVVL